ncbi:unnamed protein product [Gulo gulo]|uniref:Uncharacterized protein n=1 Tax=Gulo gulo TaxID=48420 RepID=A0A9X9LDJ1_GULGU|nr:unnamed protein product [Gulo gulo]
MKSRVPPPLPAPGEGGGEGTRDCQVLGRPGPPRARSTHGFWFS